MTDDMLRLAQARVSEGLTRMEDTLGSVRDEIVEVLGPEGGEMVTGLGKRLRATLVLLCAELGSPRTGATSTVAAVVELIHLATLIHDDSIDDSVLRRGRPTAHVTWDHKVATMLGDLLYCRAFELLVGCGNPRLSQEMARATRIMSRGELEEFLLRGSLPDERTYRRIAWAKTAVFFGACCRVGGALGGVSEEQEHTLARFGETLGMAFQVTDDILDYGSGGHGLGKDVGRDLRDGVVTLPLIVAFDRAGAEQGLLLRTVQQAREGALPVDDLVEMVTRHGGIEHAASVAVSLGDEARAMLKALPRGPVVDALDMVAQYAFKRKR